MCLAQGHNTVTPVRLEPAAPRSRVKHFTTEPLRSLVRFVHSANASSEGSDKLEHLRIHQGLRGLHFCDVDECSCKMVAHTFLKSDFTIHVSTKISGICPFTCIGTCNLCLYSLP